MVRKLSGNSTVRLGLMAPLTGVVGIYGPEISNAGIIACQEVNQQGGVLGRPLELIIEDDGSLPQTAVPAARKLLEQHQCLALIGNLLSNSRIAIAYQVAQSRHVPYLNFSFYEGSILSRYFFHFAALPNQQIDLMLPYLQKIHGSRMFFAGNNYEWPRGSIDAAKKALLRHGGSVVGEEYLPLGVSATELDALLDKVVASGCHVFVPFFAGTDQIQLLTQFTSRGLKGKIAVVMGHFDECMVSQLPANVRAGFYSSNTYFMSIETEENKRYLEALQKLPSINGLWPHGNGILTNFGEGTYLCVKAFAAAVNQCGTLETEEIVKALAKIKVQGPQGLVEMDPVTHHAKVNSFLSQCQADGTFSIIQRFGSISPSIPERYQHLSMVDSLSNSEIRMQARMLEEMSEGALLINCHDGTITYSNAGFQKMFGYSRSELVGQKACKFYSNSEDQSSLKGHEIDQILYQKGIWRGEIRTQKKEGANIWCAISISAFTHAALGEVWMAIYRDISELKEAYAKLLEAKREAEAANQAKSLFLASMSHEIRTPLNAILGMADLLFESPLTAEQCQYVGIFRAAGNNLLAIVNDILDLSKIEFQKITLERIPFPLVETIKSCLEMLQSKAKEKGLDLALREPEAKLPLFIGDPLRFKQVLLNILSNALKFTECGWVSVELITGPMISKRLPISIRIKDTGIGISALELEKIFEPFTQADSSHSRRFGGTGLGLAISRRLIEAMGGQLKVESEVSKGSVFTIDIPLEICVTDLPTQKAAEKTMGGSLRGCMDGTQLKSRSRAGQILIVDDNAENLFMLSSMLKKTSFQIEAATNGQEAIDKCKAKQYGLILMDIHMPLKDGFTAIQEIRAWEMEQNKQRSAIVAITANAMPEDREKCLSAGATDYLSKPVKKNDLLLMIEKYLHPELARAAEI